MLRIGLWLLASLTGPAKPQIVDLRECHEACADAQAFRAYAVCSAPSYRLSSATAARASAMPAIGGGGPLAQHHARPAGWCPPG